MPKIKPTAKPIIEKLDKFEVEIINDVSGAGLAKVELRKNEPKAIFHKWNGEVQLGIHYKKIQTQAVNSLSTKKVEWKGDKEEIHAYPIDDNNFEFEVILKEKPTTNKFEFEITGAKDLEFWRQRALTQEELDRGDFQPENILGSYAVYHKEKRDHKVGKTNYATGKAFHIYRPRIIDANNNEVWATLDYQNGILSIEVPQDFLDNAIYPVRIDPTLGFGSIGGSLKTIASYSGDSSFTYGQVWALGEEATLVTIHAALRTWTTNRNVDTYFAVYREDSGGSGVHEQVDMGEILSLALTPTSAWKIFTPVGESLSIDSYIFAGGGNGVDLNTPNSVRLASDNSSGSSRNWYTKLTAGASSYVTRRDEDPFTDNAFNNTDRFSVYITYEEAGPSLPTVTTQAATDVDHESATGNGNITDTGGENCDKRGIVYGESSQAAPGDVAPGASGYDDFEEESGSFGTGAFTRSLASLDPSTQYYARAYTHNTAGYSYGDEIDFTTEVTPSPNLTKRNNYNGYLAFIQQYIKHKLNGTTPWANPDGTLI